jgi:hypothetical protein
MRGAQIDLRCSAMVEAKHPAESLGTLDGVESRVGAAIRLDQPIVDPLVVPLTMIMSGVLTSRLTQRSFAEEYHPVEAFILDRPDESLCVGVGLGRRMHPMRIMSNYVFG